MHALQCPMHLHCNVCIFPPNVSPVLARHPALLPCFHHLLVLLPCSAPFRRTPLEKGISWVNKTPIKHWSNQKRSNRCFACISKFAMYWGCSRRLFARKDSKWKRTTAQDRPASTWLLWSVLKHDQYIGLPFPHLEPTWVHGSSSRPSSSDSCFYCFWVRLRRWANLGPFPDLHTFAGLCSNFWYQWPV